jgi:outer membrane lipoprotein carrier protein
MKNILTLWIITALFLGMGITPGPVPAANGSGAIATAARLQAAYEDTAGLVADFRQHTAMQLNRRSKSGSGTVVFLKPGLMRWDYLAPDRQILISDGKTITMYFEKTKQMIVTAAREYMQSDVTYSFFAGSGNIMEDFTISAGDSSVDDSADTGLIKLIPRKAHPQISRLYVWVDNDTSLIHRIRMIDHFDTVTDLFFDNIKQLNGTDPGGPAIDSELFSFNPPPGTEIINQ